MTPHPPHALAAALLILLGSAFAAGDGKPTLAASSAAAPGTGHSRVVSDARYRAIFCGLKGTETGLGYSQALALDLNALEVAGKTTVEAIAYIEARACGRK